MSRSKLATFLDVVGIPDLSPRSRERVSLPGGLNHFILFGQKHVDYLVDEFVDYYNRERAHSALGSRPPARDDPPEQNEDASPDSIVRRDRLGGIVKYYERRAA